MMTFKRSKTAMTVKHGLAVAAMALFLPMTAISTGNAVPAMSSSALSSAATSTGDVTEVQWRGHHGGGWGRGGGWGYRGGGGWGHRGGWGWGGVGAGLAAGALIGGAIAANSYPYGYGYAPGYYAPAPGYVVQPGYAGGDAVAYCMQRYRSYDPASGTYLNYDGNRYPCP